MESMVNVQFTPSCSSYINTGIGHRGEVFRCSDCNLVCVCVYVCICMYVQSPSFVCFCVTLCMLAHRAPLSMGFSRQEHWSGLPCPPRWDLPHPGIDPSSLMSAVFAGGFLPLVPPGKPQTVSNKKVFQAITFLS